MERKSSSWLATPTFSFPLSSYFDILRFYKIFSSPLLNLRKQLGGTTLHAINLQQKSCLRVLLGFFGTFPWNIPTHWQSLIFLCHAFCYIAQFHVMIIIASACLIRLTENGMIPTQYLSSISLTVFDFL